MGNNGVVPFSTVHKVYSVKDAVRWINQFIKPIEITTEDILQLWEEARIALCYRYYENEYEYQLLALDGKEVLLYLNSDIGKNRNDEDDSNFRNKYGWPNYFKMDCYPDSVDNISVEQAIEEGLIDVERLPSFSAGIEIDDLVLPSGEVKKVYEEIMDLATQDNGTVVNKPGSQKTINAQARLIKALLKMHYSADVANNPRKYFENPNSKLSIDFDEAGIKSPSGKAVEKWLKDIDIDER